MSTTTKVSVEQSAVMLSQALKEYDQGVSDAVKAAVDEQADETVEEIRAASPRKTGAYAKGWRKKKAYESSYEKRNTVHNSTRYQLAHLLEKGHARKNTDRGRTVHTSKTPRTAARVHIAPAEENAKAGLEEKIRKAVAKV